MGLRVNCWYPSIVSNVTIKLVRTGENFVADERRPLLIELSRVPCVGEVINTLGTADHIPVGYFRVTFVEHLIHPTLAARVVAEPVEP
jgi:hypothetical protein